MSVLPFRQPSSIDERPTGRWEQEYEQERIEKMKGTPSLSLSIVGRKRLFPSPFSIGLPPLSVQCPSPHPPFPSPLLSLLALATNRVEKRGERKGRERKKGTFSPSNSFGVAPPGKRGGKKRKRGGEVESLSSCPNGDERPFLLFFLPPLVGHKVGGEERERERRGRRQSRDRTDGQRGRIPSPFSFFPERLSDSLCSGASPGKDGLPCLTSS